MDLSHVFCERSAATAIKAYSPELIVHPVLTASPEASDGSDSQDNEGKVHELAMAGSGAVIEWIPRLDALLIGPGLGRNRAIIQAACHIIIAAAARGLPLILDADGLFILTSALRPGGHIPAPLAAQVPVRVGTPRAVRCAERRAAPRGAADARRR